MPHEHRPGMLYRMPYGFGPSVGPRQGPDGKRVPWSISSQRFQVGTSFLTDAKVLEALLPPQFSLVGEPVVTVEVQVMTELEWLAGRGYSTLAVRFPAAFDGSRDHAVGSFNSVMWENLADPVISGREELGFAKLWCEIPEPRVFRDRVSCTAAWLTHTFCELSVEDLVEVEPAAPPQPGSVGLKLDGTLHYKYIPDTPDGWGNAAVEHACLTPRGPAPTVRRMRHGRGNVRFLPTSWEQMPTQCNIISALAELPQLESREAWVAEMLVDVDLSKQRRLA